MVLNIGNFNNVAGLTMPLILKVGNKWKIVHLEHSKISCSSCSKGFTTVHRKLVIREINSDGIGEIEQELDLSQATGFSNPKSFEHPPGFDFDGNRILLSIADWDGQNQRTFVSESGKSKILSIGIYDIVNDIDILMEDIFGFVKNNFSDVSSIRYFVHPWIKNNLCSITLGVYDSNGGEKSFIAVSTDGCNNIQLKNVETRYRYLQEIQTPFWDGETFKGFITEGHGTNSLWVKTDGTIDAGAPPDSVFTTEPIYDPINNKIIWIEWGSGTGAVQHVWIASPSDPFNATDITPSGSITDLEGNNIDISKMCKEDGVIYMYNNELYFVILGAYRGGIPQYENRAFATKLPLSSSSQYDIIEVSNGSTRKFDGGYYGIRDKIFAVDVDNGKLTYVPVLSYILE